VAAKPSGKITTKQKPSGVFTGRDNAKFTPMSALPPKADITAFSKSGIFCMCGDLRRALESGREMMLEYNGPIATRHGLIRR
jgi:hypothetical protein